MEIQIDVPTFHSLKDELRFFTGIKEIRAVRSIRGSNRSIFVDLDLRCLSRDAILELIALLTRYQINTQPLGIIAERTRFTWLKQKNWYWHKTMFGKPGR